MLSYKNRFHGHNSVSYISRNGEVERSSLFTLKVLRNDNKKNSRVAVVISKKIIKSSVKRNRTRRRIYEIVQPRIKNFKNIFDIVIIVTSSEIIDTTFIELDSALDSIFSKKGII